MRGSRTNTPPIFRIPNAAKSATAAAAAKARPTAGRRVVFLLIIPLSLGLPGSAKAELSAEAEGHADREAFEGWINSLNAGQRQGAQTWAAERSKPKPLSCDALAKTDPDQLLGCRDARQRLVIVDARRKAETDYRRGWNAPIAETEKSTPTPSSVAPQPGPSKASVMICAQQFPAMLDEATAKRMKPDDVVSMVRALLTYVDVARQTGVKPTQAAAVGYLALWSALNAQGLTARGIASIIETADESIRRGGNMGMASQATSYRAMKAHGVMDPFSMQRLSSRGAFATLPDNSSLLTAQVSEVVREMASFGPDRIDNAGSNHLGVTMDQFQALRASLKDSDASRFAREHPIAASYVANCLSR